MSASHAARGLGHTLRALRSRNYRLFFAGQGLSLIGSWMTRVATGWLVYRLTGSAGWLGIIAFAEQIPLCLITPVAGVLADRWNKRRILLAAQILSMLQSLTLGVLALSGGIHIWHILALCFFQGLVNAFDVPARQAFVIEMVDRQEDLGNAIALNSSIFNGARLLGASMAGIVIASAGEGWCFILDAATFLAVIVALLAMRFPVRRRRVETKALLGQLLDGLKYAVNSKPIRTFLLLVALTSLMGLPYTVLMPVFAREVLQGDARTYGFLMGATGLGAVSGALYLASRRSVLGLGHVVVRAGMIFSLGLASFALARSTVLAWLLLLVTGFGMLVQMAGSNTMVQTLVDDDKRGRVMSLYALAVLGTAPFGNLLAGAMAARIGVPAALLIGAGLCMAGSVWFARALPRLRPFIHPIYVKKGILPEMVSGV